MLAKTASTPTLTAGQYFFTYNLKNAWQISMSPTFSYNHEADSGNKFTFPIGFGISKTMIFSGRPWRFNLQYWHYIETPDLFGPEFQVRFSVTPSCRCRGSREADLTGPFCCNHLSRNVVDVYVGHGAGSKFRTGEAQRRNHATTREVDRQAEELEQRRVELDELQQRLEAALAGETQDQLESEMPVERWSGICLR